MRLKILQVGEPVLRQPARPLSGEEIRSREIQQLIEWMRETMRDAPGVGLAAPQVGVSLQLAVIEDRADLLQFVAPERLAERQRRPVPFQVLINPRIETAGPEAEFFEGCLSFAGFGALVPRRLETAVDCLDHRGEPLSFRAEGWHARIVQHEVDHLAGSVYVDRMRTRSLTTMENLNRYWNDLPVQEVRARIG
ncbi:MAG: peptide deformylase [Acidobacteriia bacterium]|nr:peptide deformylase [Terriglobia bacterium]